MIEETPCEGTEGFLLEMPIFGGKDGRTVIDWKKVFRVYNSEGDYTDYEIKHFDLRVKLLDGHFFKEEGAKHGYIDYPSRKNK
jgi:hypothetical protein